MTYPKILVATLAAMVLAASAPYALAADQPKMTPAQMTEMCKTMDPAECKMMMREMLKNPKLHQAITEELRGNSEYQKYYNSHPSGGG